MSSQDEFKQTSPVAPGGSEPAPGLRFSLRFADHDVELQPGEIVIGRSPRCQMVLDDAMVSRQHARLLVQQNAVTIEDMGSVNGVTVNGERVTRPRVLNSGDRIVIGQQTFALLAIPVAAKAKDSFGKMTLSQSPRETLRLSDDLMAQVVPVDRSEATRQADAFQLLAGVVEKVLALGRGDEAERIMGHYLRSLLQAGRATDSVDPAVRERAVTYAVRIAEATGKGSWVDYAFELYAIAGQPLPSAVIERLYTSVRSISGINLAAFRQYLSVLKAADSSFAPSERFLVRRLQGLEPLLASR